MTQIIILGMLESGAGAVARLINSMGAYAGKAGKLDDAQANGPQNTWESPETKRLNDRMLAAMGNSWADCAEVCLDDIPKPELGRFQKAAEGIVQSFNEHPLWVMNDPRMSLLLELWRPLLANPICILAHRSPNAVAHSVRVRHSLQPPFGLALWERYNIAALSNTLDLPRMLVNCDELFENVRGTVRQIQVELAALGVENLTMPAKTLVDSISSSQPGNVARLPETLQPNREQGELAKALQDGSILAKAAPKLSSSSLAALGRLANRWPGQHWSKRLLRERDAQLLKYREELKALRATQMRLQRQHNAAAGGRSRGVFIIGCPRSGTSVFAWALAQHENFWTSAESDYLLQLFGNGHVRGAYKQAYERPDRGWLKLHGVDFPEFAATIGLGAEQLFESRSPGRRWVDATPSYTLMVEDLLELFPEASFLHIVRDGRSVVNSMVDSGFNVDWASDFAVACRTWVHYVSIGHKAVQLHPDRVHEVSYDRMIDNPQGELTRVFSFLDEALSERSVELIATKRINSSYGNVHATDIRKAKDPAAAPKRPWENWTEEQGTIFAEIAGEAMLQLGFEDFAGLDAAGAQDKRTESPAGPTAEGGFR